MAPCSMQCKQSMGSLSITKDLLSTCSERHTVQSSAGLRHERGRAGFSFRVNWLWIWASHFLTCSRVQFAHLCSESVPQVNSKIPSSSDGFCFCLQHLYFLGCGGRAFREINLWEWKHSETFSFLNSFQKSTHFIFLLNCFLIFRLTFSKWHLLNK